MIFLTEFEDGSTATDELRFLQDRLEPLRQKSHREATMASNNAGAAGGGAIYGLGIFGAWVYFFQQADGFWEYLLAVLQGLFWPAFMVYQVFQTLN